MLQSKRYQERPATANWGLLKGSNETEPGPSIFYKVAYAPGKDPHYSAHPCSLLYSQSFYQVAKSPNSFQADSEYCRLRGCAGWSESSLCALAILLVMLCPGFIWKNARFVSKRCVPAPLKSMRDSSANAQTIHGLKPRLAPVSSD